MAVLSVSNTFVAGTKGKASEVNTNFTDIIAWANGNIQEDNLGTMNGVVTWDNNANELSIAVTSSGNAGAVSILQDGALTGVATPVLKVENSVAETAAPVAWFYANNVGHTAPALRVSSKAGSGNYFQIDNNAGSNIFEVDASGNTTCNNNCVVGGNLDVNGAGPHAVDNNLGVTGALSGATVSSTTGDISSAADIVSVGDLDINGTGTSDFAGDVNVVGTLSAGTLSLTNITATADVTAGDDVIVGDQISWGSTHLYIEEIDSDNLSIAGKAATTSSTEVNSGNVAGLELHCAEFSASDAVGGSVSLVTSATRTQNWSVSQTYNAVGSYTVAFGMTFAVPPMVFVSATANNNNYCVVHSISTTGCSIYEYQDVAGTLTATTFGFQILVVGPRI